jgi:hypothetical protein
MALESCNIGLYHSDFNDFFFCDIVSGNRGSRSDELSYTFTDGDLELLKQNEETGLSLEDLEDEKANPRLIMPINLVMFNKLETEE